MWNFAVLPREVLTVGLKNITVSISGMFIHVSISFADIFFIVYVYICPLV